MNYLNLSSGRFYVFYFTQTCFYIALLWLLAKTQTLIEVIKMKQSESILILYQIACLPFNLIHIIFTVTVHQIFLWFLFLWNKSNSPSIVFKIHSHCSSFSFKKLHFQFACNYVVLFCLICFSLWCNGDII